MAMSIIPRVERGRLYFQVAGLFILVPDQALIVGGAAWTA
jgi:hypothetical protein